jgi:large conductance mechanosensitive channel
MLRDFKTFTIRKNFLLRANVFELAIGVTFIFAIQKVINAIIMDIVLPMIDASGLLNVSNYFAPLSHNVSATNLVDAKKQGPVLAYGELAATLLDWLIVALVLMVVLKLTRAMKIQNAPPNSSPVSED